MTDKIFDQLKTHFTSKKDVIILSGSGSQGLKFKGKMVVMFTKKQIIVRLDPKLVSELISIGEGLPHDPGTGKPMKGWVIIPETKKKSWIKYCEEAINVIG